MIRVDVEASEIDRILGKEDKRAFKLMPTPRWCYFPRSDSQLSCGRDLEFSIYSNRIPTVGNNNLSPNANDRGTLSASKRGG